MNYLLDTNVVSETRKPQPNANVVEWFGSVSSDELYVSVLALGEIRLGIEGMRRRDSPQAAGLERWLKTIRKEFDERIVPIDETIADRWGGLNVPDRLAVVDSLQAATAIVHDWTLVTRNTKDVERTGVKVLNPFEKRGSRR